HEVRSIDWPPLYDPVRRDYGQDAGMTETACVQRRLGQRAGTVVLGSPVQPHELLVGILR
ncbi:MAG: hypothetical protein Q8N93_05890, partial [Bacillota bacterium]|nr:hypothetical protein [Bacillota bacterium]